MKSVVKRIAVLALLLVSLGGSQSFQSADLQSAEALRNEYDQLTKYYQELELKYREQKRQVDALDTRANILPMLCGGRLTTLTGSPYPETNRTSQSTIYFTPCAGNRITLYTSSVWKLFTFSELSLALSGLTTGKNYDIFIYNNSGTAALELGAAWTSDTVRSTALTTQDGVWVKSGDATRRYIGTFRATSATTTADADSNRLLWNLCNRTKRSLLVLDATDTWTYAASPWRQTRATGTNMFGIVIGINDSMLGVRALLQSGSATGMPWVSTGIGIDSTTASSALLMGGTSNANLSTQLWADYLGYPGEGYHAINWLETTDASATVTFYGDNGTTFIGSGMMGWVEG